MGTVALIPVEKFTIKYGDSDLGEFKVESKWNGMVKLCKDNGDVIIISDNTSFIDTLFMDFFSDKKPEPKDFVIISASTNLLPK